MFIFAVIANVITLVIVTSLIIYWESTPTLRKYLNDSCKRQSQQSMTPQKHINGQKVRLSVDIPLSAKSGDYELKK